MPKAHLFPLNCFLDDRGSLTPKSSECQSCLKKDGASAYLDHEIIHLDAFFIFAERQSSGEVWSSLRSSEEPQKN